MPSVVPSTSRTTTFSDVGVTGSRATCVGLGAGVAGPMVELGEDVGLDAGDGLGAGLAPGLQLATTTAIEAAIAIAVAACR
jgi:hypothetical protein